MKKSIILLVKKIYRVLKTFIKENINYLFSIYLNQNIYKKLNSITKIDIFKKSNGSYIIDGHFYNLGYFFRLQLIRSATKSYLAKEIGFIWKYNIKKCRYFLNSSGIKVVKKMPHNKNYEDLFEARKIYAKLKSPEDIFDIEFPFQTPNSFLYDYILKKQLSATVNVKDENIIYYISEYLESIRFSSELIINEKPKQIFMSHPISVQCAPICWIGSKYGIPVTTLFGNYGLPRFIKIKQPKDIFIAIDRPIPEDFKKLSENQKAKLHDIGELYLDYRINGKSNDIGGKLAYDCEMKNHNQFFQNKKNKPIISVYASNWFDCPHAFGMKRFKDFYDWIKVTLESAIKNTNFIWIFRAHPGDTWYGGVTLKDLLPEKLPDHVFIMPKDFSGKYLMDISDGLVTFHSTAGIEYASQGKPVLVADRGWYHDLDFVLYPNSREEYINFLGEDWINKVNIKKAKKKAKIFSGIYFCNPSWQSSLNIPDDSNYKKLRDLMPNIIINKKELIEKEIFYIKSWLKSDHKCYHTYKMINSDNYALSNIE